VVELSSIYDTQHQYNVEHREAQIGYPKQNKFLEVVLVNNGITQELIPEVARVHNGVPQELIPEVGLPCNGIPQELIL
jgi:hypothetical protein